MRHAQHCRGADCADVENRPAAVAPGGPPNIEAGGRTLAICMDYPCEHVREQGRETMRKHAPAVLDAARKGTPCS